MVVYIRVYIYMHIYIWSVEFDCIIPSYKCVVVILILEQISYKDV
jgi:hypothetical protein